MFTIKVEAFDNGAHANQNGSPLKNIPDGWAIIPEGMEIPVTFPFVNVEAKNGVVTAMTANQEAFDAAKAKKTDAEPSTDDVINAMLGVTE